MLITTLGELDNLIQKNSYLVIKVFNRHNQVYEIDEVFNNLSKSCKYDHVTFAVFDMTDLGILPNNFYKLDGFPAFIVYRSGRTMGSYTGSSNTTLRVMMERYF